MSYASDTVFNWFQNDEYLYNEVNYLLRRYTKDQAAKMLLDMLPEKTPCKQVKYTFTNIRQALVNWN